MKRIDLVVSFLILKYKSMITEFVEFFMLPDCFIYTVLSNPPGSGFNMLI